MVSVGKGGKKKRKGENFRQEHTVGAGCKKKPGDEKLLGD